MGEVLTRENDNEVRRGVYFVQLLNGSEIDEIEGNVRRRRIGRNKRLIRKVVREEIMDGIKVVKQLV